MFDLRQCREILGAEANNLTDDQMESIRKSLYTQAYIIFDFWKKDKLNKKETLCKKSL